MELDSAIQGLVSAAFALLFLAAAVHKFSDRLRFQGILAAYDLFPATMIPLMSIIVPVLELCLGIAWATQFSLTLVASMTAILLGSYAAAIAVNLFRGRTEIDCGCGFSSSASSSSGQGISAGLVLRNMVLIALALLPVLGNNGRVLGILDFAGIALALLTLTLIYGAINQIIANQHIINGWRKPLMERSQADG